MSTLIDFAPLYRSTVGFDRVANLLENAGRLTPANNWPPYDIAKTADDRYRIEIAAAGFGVDDISITQQQNLLVVAGSKSESVDAEYLHRGVATRNFERRFELADHIEVIDAQLENGLLRVELKREVPDEMKPRKIPIAAARPGVGPNETKQIAAAPRAA
ncbi:MAG TPA: Hsp20 family protein [Hansschlegelia sp.]